MKILSASTAFLIVLLSVNSAFSQLDFKDPIAPPDETTPEEVTTGDFDGNGKQDIAYTTTESVFILLNQGGLAFDTVRVKGLRLHFGVHPMTSGHLNNDGIPEIIVYDNNTTKSKVIVISFSDSEFTTSRYEVSGEFILSKAIVVGDYNNDGEADIICGTDSGPAQILEGSASEAFTLKELDLGESILNLAVTDLNNDGKTDFVAANYSTQLTTYIAAGDSYTKEIFTGNHQYSDILIEDFSGDGFNDAIVTPFSGTTIHYFVNDGSGNLTKSDITSSLNANKSLDAADYNNDGRLDFVTIGYNYSRIMLFKNNGNGTFEEQPLVSSEYYFNDVRFVNLDNDSAFEILGLNTMKSIQIFKDIAGHYENIKVIVTGTSPHDGILTDLNLDGNMDLISISSLAHVLSVYYGDGTGHFNARQDYLIGSELATVQAADFNSDGFKDIVFVSFYSDSPKTGLILSTSNGELSADHVTLASEVRYGLQVGDFNDDEKMDFITGTLIYLGNGDGTFSTIAFSVPYDSFHLDAGDLDGDSIPDLVISDGNALHYFLNNGAAQLSPAQAIQIQTSVSDLKLANMNDDNKAEILIASEGDKSITILFPDSTGSFVTKTIETDFPVSGIDAADLDQDGRIDIIAGVFATGEIRKLAIYLQDAEGGFNFYGGAVIENYPYKILAGDLNNDMYPDLVGVTANNPTVKIALNDFTSQPQLLASSIAGSANLHDATIELTPGDGDARIILIREGNSVDSTPDDQVFYAANSAFTVGAEIGNDNYVVVSGDSVAVTITGLKEETVYFISVFEYNVNSRNTIINYASDALTFSFLTKKSQHIAAVSSISLTQLQDTLAVVRTSSGLPVSLEIISGNATVAGDTILIDGPGPIEVTASQAGNSVFYRTDTTFSFCVYPPIPVITLEQTGAEMKLVSSSSSNNQWLQDGEAITGENDQDYQVVASNVYTVEVDYDGCSNLSEEFHLLITSSENSLEKNIHIYPNPAASYLHIESIERPKSVTIYDVLGNRIYTSSDIREKHDVPLRSVQKGILFVLVETSQGKTILKIYKE